MERVLIYNIRERMRDPLQGGVRGCVKGEQAIIRFLGESKLYTPTHIHTQIIILQVLEKRISYTVVYNIIHYILYIHYIHSAKYKRVHKNTLPH